MRSDHTRPPWLWPVSAAFHLGAATLDWLGDAFDAEPTEPLLGIDELAWTTQHDIVLDTKALRLRQFGSNSGRTTLIVAPYALHGPQLADLAPGHSLIERLLGEGLERVVLLEWKSATPSMCFLAIDDYIARLAAVLEDLGPPVDVIGLCQGGWLSLMLAARFPTKVSRLVLAAAPVDLAAAPSALVEAASRTPPALFRSLVRDGGGLLSGERALSAWNVQALTSEGIAEFLQTERPDDEALARAQAWHARLLSLPGAYFIQVAEDLFRHNKLARGEFVALGRKLDLKTVRIPLFLIGAEEDDISPPAQVFAARSLVGASGEKTATAMGTGGHTSLFVGARNLDTVWRDVAHWLLDLGTAPDLRRRLTAPRPKAVSPLAD